MIIRKCNTGRILLITLHDGQESAEGLFLKRISASPIYVLYEYSYNTRWIKEAYYSVNELHRELSKWNDDMLIFQ